MRLTTFAAAAVAVTLTPAFVTAETIVANDSVDSDFNGTTATAELIEGEMYEAVFDIPEDWLPVEMLGVRVVMVQGAEAGEYCAQFGLEVWEEGNNPTGTANCLISNVRYKDPGMNLFSQLNIIDPMTGTPYGYEIVGDPNRGNATYKDMRFSTINMIPGVTINPVILNTSRIRVGIRALSEQCTAGGTIRTGRFPVLLSDTDGVSKPLQNFIYGEPLFDIDFDGNPDPICTPAGNQHYAWEDFGAAFTMSQPGDWVMKLILNRDDGMVMVDMGMGGGDAGPDMGTEDFGGNMTPDDAGADMGSGEADMGSGQNNGTNNGNNNGTNNGTGAAIAIESITPDEGPNDASTNVVILGEGFEAGAEVLLGAEAIGVTETRSERIRATVPEGLTAGTYDVIVTNPDGASARLADGYTVLEGAAPPDDGDSTGGRGADGCCSEVRGSRSSSALGLGILALVFGFLSTARARNRR